MAGAGLGAGWAGYGRYVAGGRSDNDDAEGAALEDPLIASARDARKMDEPLRPFTASPVLEGELEQIFCQKSIAARQKAVFFLRSQSIQRR